jgi:hypothetical protein
MIFSKVKSIVAVGFIVNPAEDKLKVFIGEVNNFGGSLENKAALCRIGFIFNKNSMSNNTFIVFFRCFTEAVCEF